MSGGIASAGMVIVTRFIAARASSMVGSGAFPTQASTLTVLSTEEVPKSAVNTVVTFQPSVMVKPSSGSVPYEVIAHSLAFRLKVSPSP